MNSSISSDRALRAVATLLIVALASLSGSASGQTPVSFEAPDGLEVSADLYQPASTPRATLLLFHQSMSSRGEYREIAPRLVAEGFEAIAVDLRWGRSHGSSGVLNETARRNGIDSIIAKADAGDRSQVWPTIFATEQDIMAAIEWARSRPESGPIVVVGSSFSAMMVLKVAGQSELAGVVAYSPGEYYGQDSTMARRWATAINEPSYFVAAPGEEELVSTVADSVPEHLLRSYVTHQGRHAASVLDADPLAMSDLVATLNGWFPKTAVHQPVEIASTDGVTVRGRFYQGTSASSGAPVVVMLHQGGASAVAEHVRTLPRILATGSAALLVDLRRGGDRFGGRNFTSRQVGNAGSYCAAMPDLEVTLGWLNANHPNRPIVLIGSSYSATLAMHVATGHTVAGVVALSPAGGAPMADCPPEQASGLLTIPTIVGRPSSEMARPSAANQAEVFRSDGHTVLVVEDGVHGASMLDERRHSGDASELWERIIALIEGSSE